MSEADEASPLRAFEEFARALSDCARMESESTSSGTSYTLTPNNPRSVGVFLWDFGNGAYYIAFDDEMDPGDDQGVDVEAVEYYVSAAVEGRVRALHGPRRGTIEVRQPDGIVTKTHYYDVGAWLPKPGWKKRAKVLDYEPYRA